MSLPAIFKRIGDPFRITTRISTLISTRISTGVSAAMRASGPADGLLAPRVSLVGALGICLVLLVLTLSAASTVTLLRLRSGMQADLTLNMNQIQAGLQDLERELIATDRLLVGADCGAIRPLLVRSSIDSALARQILFRLPESDVICGPLAGLDSNILAALDRFAERMSNGDPGDYLMFEPMTTIEPGLLVLRSGGSRGLLIAQLDLKRLSSLIGASAGGFGRSKQLSLVQGANYRLTPRTGIDTVSAGRFASTTLTRLHAPDGAYPIKLTGLLTLGAYVEEMTPLLLPTFALALALTALLIARVNSRMARRASPEHRLRQAVRLRQFEPVVQPIVDTRTGRCLGGEILMRWDHPVRGLVAPAEFINQAEQTGLIIPMTDMIMRKARDRLASALKQFPDLYFSFNVTVGQLADPAFPDALDKLFDEQSLPVRNVVLEMIERDAVDARVGAGLAELRRRGYRIAIDDFGTGQSSLSVLAKTECDRLKIDREFVRAIDEDTINRPVLDAIIDLAQRLHLPTIAEGVETQAQRAYLSARGVDALQGYLIAKPLPISEFLIWLGDNDAWARSADAADQSGHLSRLGVVNAN